MLPNAHAIVLEETPERTGRLSSHLAENGVEWTQFEGIHAEAWGLSTLIPYDVDAPGSGYIMPQKHVGLHLSHYFLWRKFRESGFDVMTVMEDDVNLLHEWQDGFGMAMNNVPDDWDMLFLGSGNTFDKPKEQVAHNVWRVRWPQCTHLYMVRKKALPVLLSTQKRSWAPIDLSLIFGSFPHLNVYTVLPRLATQHGQEYIHA